MAERRDALRELQEFEQVFAALAHETRRRILVVLVSRGGEMGAGKIVERFRCSWPTVSRHLRILEDAGLVRSEKVGRERKYVLDRRRLHGVVENWIQWFKPKGSPS